MSDKSTPVGEAALLRGLCLSPEQAGIARQQSSSGGSLLGKHFGH
ncbi:MAG TPA: hypothetical protein VHU79_10140 [Sphingomicrobium sp.]|nr:hypothetical protein [Sphingomicrobium sp.]